MASLYADKIGAIQRDYTKAAGTTRAGKIQDGLDVGLESIRVALQMLDATMKLPGRRTFEQAVYRASARENLRDIDARKRALRDAMHAARFSPSELQAIDSAMYEKVDAVCKEALAALGAQMKTLL